MNHREIVMRNVVFSLFMLSLSTFSVAQPNWSLELDDAEMAHAAAPYQQ